MTLTIELTYLTLAATFTALMWIPYILNMILVRGLVNAVGYPQNPPPMSPWAERMKAAHYNAVENLVVFAALVIVAHLAGVKTAAAGTACIVFFWTRVVHYLAYTFKIPWVRTLSFVVGFACQMVLAWQILART